VHDASEAYESVLSPEWATDAACRGRSALFFAPHAERPQARVRREAQARQVCAECAVLLECRSFARSNREYGFWGGESEDERAAAGFPVPAAVGSRRRARLQASSDAPS
jgi:WhiB family redox-sensing transcriptional regulator